MDTGQSVLSAAGRGVAEGKHCLALEQEGHQEEQQGHQRQGVGRSLHLKVCS